MVYYMQEDPTAHWTPFPINSSDTMNMSIDFSNVPAQASAIFNLAKESLLASPKAPAAAPASQINFSDPLLLAAVFFAFFNPIAWNLGGRVEYHTRLLTKICGGRKYLACYIFAAYIFTIGIIRDFVYKIALMRQPTSASMMSFPLIDPIAYLCLTAGSTLVLSSMYKLGITGTYLGDHFGILMSSRISSFPFNVVEHPMYYGSTLCFFSMALRMKSPAGLFITSLVALAYGIAAEYEGKFTTKIYSKKRN